jgi:hypothetical protein
VIDVSAHGVDRRQRAEPRKYIRAANIPGMDDGIAAGKRRECLRPQQAMGIGNRANGSHHARSAYKMSRVHREPPFAPFSVIPAGRAGAVDRLMVIAGAEGPNSGRSPVLDIGRREFITFLGVRRSLSTCCLELSSRWL